MQTPQQNQGKKGEQIACDYLIKKGYQILERNWTIGHLEIDLIAETGNELVIVEVKTRKSSTFGAPEDFVTKQKQKNLIRATNIYIAKTGNSKEVRFDIISVISNDGLDSVKHLEGAFTPCW